MKRSTIILLFLFILVLPLSLGETWKYNYLDSGEEVQYGHNYSINVNHSTTSDLASDSLLFNDYSVSGLYGYYRGLLETYFNGVYCKLTGCSMTGNLSTTGDVEANTLTLDGETITNWDDYWVKSTGSTGLIHGGILSINADNTKYNIEAGAGYIVDGYTDAANPTVTKVEWATQTAITLSTLTTNTLTYISIDINGDIVESIDLPSAEDRRDKILIGLLIHTNRVIINDKQTTPIWTQDSIGRDYDFYTSIGRVVNIEGNVYSFNGANQKIDKSAGELFAPGFNYANDKKNPNIVVTDATTAGNFFLIQKTPTVSIFTYPSDIPTDKYDPNQDGTLVDIPEGRFVAHRVFYAPAIKATAIQYAQYSYDSLKKASESYDKEDFSKVPEVQNIVARAVIIVKSNITDLSVLTDAKFVSLGRLGDINFPVIPSYARFAEPVELVDGLSYEKQELTPVVDGGNLYVDVERLGGGDMTYVFGQREYILDCTNGAGINGSARIQLTLGTATNPQENYIYIIRSGDEAILQASTTRPTGEFAYVGKGLFPDLATFQTDGAYSTQRYTEAKAFDGRSAVQRNAERLRTLNAEYETGLAQTVTITSNVGSPDDVDFENALGEVWQKHLQGFPARQVSVDGIYIVNHPTTPYLKVTDLADIMVDADGNSLSGKRFNLVIWGVVSKTTGACKIFVNLPLGTYGSDADVIADPDSSSVTSIPKELRGTGFLIARLPLRHTVVSGGTWTNIADSELGIQVIDLRGHAVGTYAGSASIPASSVFDDGSFTIFDNVDNTKELQFEVSEVTTGNTRTLTIPDSSGTIALTSDLTSYFTNSSNVTHDDTTGFVANEHIDWTDATDDFVTTESVTIGVESVSLGTGTIYDSVGPEDYDTIEDVVPSPIPQGTNGYYVLFTSGVATGQVASIAYAADQGSWNDKDYLQLTGLTAYPSNGDTFEIYSSFPEASLTITDDTITQSGGSISFDDINLLDITDLTTDTITTDTITTNTITAINYGAISATTISAISTIDTDSYYMIDGAKILDRTLSNSLGVGSLAGITGAHNVNIGYNAGSSGNYNTNVGVLAGTKTSGSYNTMIGRYAGKNAVGGFYNTILGESAGLTITGGQRNILIGAGADTTYSNQNDYLNIGDLIIGGLAGTKYIAVDGHIKQADNKYSYQGTADDVASYYDGTDWIFNPKIIGSGIMKILGDLWVNEDLTVVGDTLLNNTEITGNLTINGNLGLTGNYTNGNCWNAYNGGIMYETNCSTA